MSSTSSLMTPEARAAISVLRAVAVSRRYPASIREITKDYRALEGNSLNYKKLGFTTLEDFLAASGEFTISKINGETCIAARPSKESAHISEMIRRQKSRKTKKRSSPVGSFRQPQRSDQSWNKSSYSSYVYQTLPQASSTRQNNRLSSRNRSKRSSDTNRGSGDTNNNSNQNNRNSQSKPQQQQQSSNKLQQNASSQVSNRILNNQQTKQQSTRQSSLPQQQQTIQQTSAVSEKKSSNLKQPRPILGQTNGNKQPDAKQQSNNVIQNRLQNQQQQNTLKSAQGQNNQNKQNEINNIAAVQSNVPKAQVNSTSLSKRLQRIGGNNSTLMNQEKDVNTKTPPTQLSQLINAAKTETVSNSPPTQQQNLNYSMPSAPASTRSSRIQDRLKLNQAPQAVLNGTMMNKSGSVSPGDSPSSVLSNNFSVINKETNKTKETERKSILPINFEFNPTLNPVTSLAQYCIVKKYANPEYKFLKPKFSNQVQCRVLVNGSIYSTYPDEYNTRDEAQIACAILAIEQLKILEAKKNCPVCTDSDPELALKIYQELQNHPHGIFCKNIPDMFEKAFNKCLPEHWLAIVQSSKQFLLESTAGDHLIVFANSDNSESSAASTTSETEFIIMDKVTLPWEAKYWNLYVTCCISTIEIWARIVGEEYSDALDSLMNDIDVYMLTDKSRPTSISVGQIYLVCISECWHRVRVEDMDKAAGKCLCFFIDFGDEEWCSMDQLFICEMKFLKLPPQAIPFSLFGLEDFAENPCAKRHLDEMLIGMPLVGEILTKKDSFECKNGSNDDFNAKIQVVLYNTSSIEDVNLNPLIMNKICDDTPPPELKKNGVTNVNITHVNSAGEIFLQVRHLGLSYVQKLINQLVESKFKEENYKVTSDDIKKLNLFLVRDTEDNRWYRGALAKGDYNPNDTQLSIFYVDYGKIKLTDIKNIFRLESLSAALSKFPKQVIKAKLHNIPPINNTIVARMRGLLPPDDPAIVKLAVHAIIPQIIVYRRFEANQGLYNVNEVIQIEYELESQSDAIIEIGRQSPVSVGREKSSSPIVGQSSTTDLSPNMRGISLKSPLTVPNSPQKGELPKIPENTKIPEKDNLFDVYVAMASNPSNFIVQPYNHGPQLLSMMSELQEYCANNDDFIPSDMVEVGQAYAALNTDDFYHRVIVENILDSSMIHVYYCDFGDIAVLGNDKLKTLPTKFRILPKQAISAKLYGVKPKHGDWTLEDCIRFKELTVGKMFASIIKDVTSDTFSPNSKILELDLIDVETEQDIFIREILIDENRAMSS